METIPDPIVSFCVEKFENLRYVLQNTLRQHNRPTSQLNA